MSQILAFQSSLMISGCEFWPSLKNHYSVTLRWRTKHTYNKSNQFHPSPWWKAGLFPRDIRALERGIRGAPSAESITIAMKLHTFVFTSLATMIDRAVLRPHGSGQMFHDEPFWDQTAEFYSPYLPYQFQLSPSADNTHVARLTCHKLTKKLKTHYHI